MKHNIFQIQKQGLKKRNLIIFNMEFGSNMDLRNIHLRV